MGVSTKTYRLSDDTQKKLNAVLEEKKKELGLNSIDEAMAALVDVIELANSKKNLPGVATIIDDYEVHVRAIHDILVALLESNTNAEARAKKDFQRELEEKSQLISSLQKNVETLTDERDKANVTIKRLEEKVKLQAQTLTQQYETIKYQKELIESLKQKQPSQPPKSHK